MIIRKFFAVAIGCNCLFHQCFARAPEDAVLCGVITANLVRCLDVYGEPFDTSCTNVPCVLGVSIRAPPRDAVCDVGVSNSMRSSVDVIYKGGFCASG